MLLVHERNPPTEMSLVPTMQAPFQVTLVRLALAPLLPTTPALAITTVVAAALTGLATLTRLAPIDLAPPHP